MNQTQTEAYRLLHEWLTAYDEHAAKNTAQTDAAEERTFDELVGFIETHDLGGARFDPRDGVPRARAALRAAGDWDQPTA